MNARYMRRQQQYQPLWHWFTYYGQNNIREQNERRNKIKLIMNEASKKKRTTKQNKKKTQREEHTPAT